MEWEIYLNDKGKEALKKEQSERVYFPSADDTKPDYMVLLSENEARNLDERVNQINDDHRKKRSW